MNVHELLTLFLKLTDQVLIEARANHDLFKVAKLMRIKRILLEVRDGK